MAALVFILNKITLVFAIVFDLLLRTVKIKTIYTPKKTTKQTYLLFVFVIINLLFIYLII